MQPHKHAVLIKAWADGAKIECKDGGSGEWVDCYGPAWTEYGEYRIKPDPVYPVTRMSGDELYLMYMHDKNKGSESVVVVVNAAIRRAIEDGDVILPNKD